MNSEQEARRCYPICLKARSIRNGSLLPLPLNYVVIYSMKILSGHHPKENAMPGRGGRIGGGSRGGGFRAPRVSSGGSKGFRLNFGNRASRVSSPVSSTPSAPSTLGTDTSSPHHVHHHRPWFRNRLPGAWQTGWRFVGVLVALFVFGMCACVALGFALQAMGYGG